ncbi:MAG: hypothetical protein KGH75_05125 [Rhodospirillales bacterium]|nr:hypothetical protein [Rhodospirillales bacterium]
MAKRPVFTIVASVAAFGLLTACAAPGSQTALLGGTPPVSEQALKGSSPQVLDADFGAPMLRRVDGPAQVWLYHSASCGMNVFLYPDAQGAPRVAAVVPDAGDNPVNCMQSFEKPATAAALEQGAAS